MNDIDKETKGLTFCQQY